MLKLWKVALPEGETCFVGAPDEASIWPAVEHALGSMDKDHPDVSFEELDEAAARKITIRLEDAPPGKDQATLWEEFKFCETLHPEGATYLAGPTS